MTDDHTTEGRTESDEHGAMATFDHGTVRSASRLLLVAIALAFLLSLATRIADRIAGEPAPVENADESDRDPGQ